LRTKCTKKQNALAEFILNDYKNAAFLNSVQLANDAGVSNATVIRFATILGYEGFNQMQQALQSMVQQELSSVDRLSLLVGQNQKSSQSYDERLSFFYQEQTNLKNTLHSIDPEQITEAAQHISQAQNVIVTGFQASHSLANYCRYTLSKIRGRVYQFHEWNREAHTLVNEANDSCIAIVIALSRYPSITIDFMKHFAQKNISVILITDSLAFPCCDLADIIFEVPVAYYSYVDSFSSVFCLINCLMLEIVNQNPEKARANMEEFEAFASENHVYFAKKETE